MDGQLVLEHLRNKQQGATSMPTGLKQSEDKVSVQDTTENPQSELFWQNVEGRQHVEQGWSQCLGSSVCETEEEDTRSN